MEIFLFIRLIFLILSVAAASFVFPVVTAFCYGEFSVLPAFLVPGIATLAAGAALLFCSKKSKVKFSTRSAFSFVALSWISISLWGTLPLILSGASRSFTAAFFESVSGFTTTGATVFDDVESLPHAVNMWRCEMHWLGGMGIIALTVALLPLLGTGGFQLVKNESTGPDKGKITPKMTDTAKVLWFLYIGFTAAQTAALKIAGLSLFDSICVAFSSLGTGGFSVLNASISGYHSAAVEIICTVFMFLAGVNFSLYFYLVSGKFEEVRKNSELKAYISIFVFFALMITLILLPRFGFAKSLRLSSFQVTSVMTTTGFYTADYMAWPPAAQFFIFTLLFIGGSSGSTAGGFKVVRWVVLAKQAKNEMLRMLHPHGVFSISVDGNSGRKDLVFNVAAFTFVYFALVFVSTLISTLCGLDLFTGFSASLSMISNTGATFGTLGATGTYGAISPFLKTWFCFVMIAGRLELYNLIIFFFPDYWRK